FESTALDSGAVRHRTFCLQLHLAGSERGECRSHGDGHDRIQVRDFNSLSSMGERRVSDAARLASAVCFYPVERLDQSGFPDCTCISHDQAAIAREPDLKHGYDSDVCILLDRILAIEAAPYGRILDVDGRNSAGALLQPARGQVKTKFGGGRAS